MGSTLKRNRGDGFTVLSSDGTAPSSWCLGRRHPLRKVCRSVWSSEAWSGAGHSPRSEVILAGGGEALTVLMR